MIRRFVQLVLAFPMALFACQSGSAPQAAAPPAPESSEATATSSTDDASTLDGVYTAAQATRGRQVFDDVCSECHNIEEWTDTVFKARWEGESVYRFWYYIYEQMPNGAPPYTLEREQVTDVMTYIFQLNGLPAGSAELGPDDDSIDDYWLRWTEPSR